MTNPIHPRSRTTPRNGDFRNRDINRSFQPVAIDCPGFDGCFMGDQTDSFIAEVDALCKRYPSL